MVHALALLASSAPHSRPGRLDLQLQLYNHPEPVHQRDPQSSLKLQIKLRRTSQCNDMRDFEGRLMDRGHGWGAVQASLGDKEPTAQDMAAAAARKTSQEQMQRLYRDSLVSQRSEIVLVEGMAIREALQEKVRSH